MSTKIAVVVVNYRTADLSLAAIESVLTRDHGPYTVDIHLVDNASPLPEVQRLRGEIINRGWTDVVTFHPEQENHGYGRAHNIVFKALAEAEETPKYVMLLNPDAELKDETLQTMAAFLDANEAAAVVGPRISLPDGTPRTAAFRAPSVLGEFVAATSLGILDRLLPGTQVPLPPDAPSGPVDWVAGAAMMARFDALKRAGWFDPAYFLYYEEVDLMRRLREMGEEVWYLNTAAVQHHEGASTKVRSVDQGRKRQPDYVYKSWAIYFVAAKGRLGAIGAAFGKLTGTTIDLLVSALTAREASAPTHFYRDFWKYSLLPILTGRERDTDPVRQSEDSTPPVRAAEPWRFNQNPSEVSFWGLVAEDFKTHERDAFSQGFWTLFWHRYGNWRMGIHWRPLRIPFSIIYRCAAKLGQWTTGIDLPYSVMVGRRVRIDHFGGIILVPESIGDDVVLRQNTTMGIARVEDLNGRPKIGNNVDVGAGAAILGPITVGDGAKIGANAVVVNDVAPGDVVGGVPARSLSTAQPDPVAAQLSDKLAS